MDYYLAIKRNEESIQATPWMNFDNIMLTAKSVTKEHILYDSTNTRCSK